METERGEKLGEFIEVVMGILEQIRPIVTDGFGGKIAVEQKGDGSPVTVVDKRCEGLIREVLYKHFPEHGFLGEEYGAERENAEYVWVIDPIDGTKSFISGALDFGTLIGLLHRGMPILGFIAQPVLNQIMWGDNYRCWYNGQQVRVRSDVSLSDSLCLTTNIKTPAQFQNGLGFEALVQQVGSLMTWGNAFGYMLVARGLADVMIDPIMNAWDLLPLIPVIRGAGGIITDYQGRDPLRASSIVAGTPSLHSRVIEILNCKETCV